MTKLWARMGEEGSHKFKRKAHYADGPQSTSM